MKTKQTHPPSKAPVTPPPPLNGAKLVNALLVNALVEKSASTIVPPAPAPVPPGTTTLLRNPKQPQKANAVVYSIAGLRGTTSVRS